MTELKKVDWIKLKTELESEERTHLCGLAIAQAGLVFCKKMIESFPKDDEPKKGIKPKPVPSSYVG